MSLCTDRSFVNADSLSAEIRGLRCKKWDCDICRPYNRMRVMQIAKSGQPNLFMTLTVSPKKYKCPADAARDMKRGLVLLRRQIERRWNVKNIPFIVVFEQHESGWPHMHLLMRAPFMHWKVLRGMWTSITGSFMVDIREIKKTSQILFYVTKYIGKNLCKFAGCKRWWRSQNYTTLKDDYVKAKPRGLMYMRVDGEWHVILETLYQAGWYIEETGRYRAEVEPLDLLDKRRLDGQLWSALAKMVQ